MLRQPGVTPRAYDPNAARTAATQLICYSDDDVRRALARLAVSGNAAAQRPRGLEIIFRQQFTVPRPYVVPSSVSGLTIRSTSGAPIQAQGNVSSLFRFEGTVSNIRLVDLVVDGSATNWFTALVSPDEDATFISILGCNLHVDCIVNDGASLEQWRIIGNNTHKVVNTLPLITGTLEQFRVESNMVVSAGGDFFVTTGSQNGLINNDVAGTTINTAGGSGGNTIVANRRRGTITNHTTDHVGLNAA